MLIVASIVIGQLSIEATQGPGRGKHIVLLAGDEEYRSEEGLPQLAKILSSRHGFRCTVLFSIGPDGTIDPREQRNQPGMEALKTADLVIMLLRFRQWPDAQMAHFDAYLRSGKPILALRTSTHAFDYAPDSASAYRRYGWRSEEWPGGFGKQVLGENWVSHWGNHGSQATLGVVEPGAEGHPVLRGVGNLFGTSDVYEAFPPADSEILVRGRVLSGMNSGDAPAAGRKKTAAGKEQDLNDPMMPIVWVRRRENTVVTCTMGAATDLLDENLRRLLVNASLWMCGVPVPKKADVAFVGDYKPSAFGFDGFKKGVRPGDLGGG